MKKNFKWALVQLAVVFALLQLTNPARTNPPVEDDLMASSPPPPQVAAMLRAACYDCHSNETKWPWYARLAPMSWLIVKDVNEGREALNLSEWPTTRPTGAAKRLGNMSEEIDYQKMPPQKYTALHPSARLTEAGRKELIAWLDTEAARLKATAGE